MSYNHTNNLDFNKKNPVSNIWVLMNPVQKLQMKRCSTLELILRSP